MNRLLNVFTGLVWCAIAVIPFMLYIWGYGM